MTCETKMYQVIWCDAEEVMLEGSDHNHLQTNGLARSADDASVGGLFLVVKQSIASEGSPSLPSSVISTQLSTDTEEQVFQRSFLNKKLKRTESETVYEIYKMRVHHTLMVVYLLVSVVSNAFPVIVSLGSLAKNEQHQPPSERTRFTVVPIVARSIALFVNLTVFILSLRERLFRRNAVRLSVAVTLILAGFFAEYAATLHDFFVGPIRETDPLQADASPLRIRNSFCFILGITIFLPFPTKLQASLAGLILVLVEFTVSLKVYSTHSGKEKFVAAEFVAHVVALFVGCYVRFLMDITNKKSFLERRDLLKTKRKLNDEKEREEQLMLSIMPKCETTEKVRADLRDRILKLKNNSVVQKHGFNELYITEHPKVTILYADIVNSMQLASALNPAALLETLDQLYAKFDERAERNNCLRIKLLGDCYYCVSGIPEYQENHANNCVNMALDMIAIIRHVREDRQVDVDMRIGIHSGSVLSGILGLKRWQFDIWSTDARIASHMEQSGKPGCVHITQATRDLLQGDYDIRDGDGVLGVQFGANLKTYFVHPPPYEPVEVRKFPGTCHRKSSSEVTIANGVIRTDCELGNAECNNNSRNTANSNSKNLSSGSEIVLEMPRQPSSYLPSLNATSTIGRPGSHFIRKQNSVSTRAKNTVGGYKRGSSLDAAAAMVLRRRKTNDLNISMNQYHMMIQEINKMLEKEVYRMPLSKLDQWFRPDGVHPLFLTFTQRKLEARYASQPDPLFRYYLLCLFIVLVGMSVVHFTIISYSSAPWRSIVCYVLAYIVLILANFAAWTGFVWTKFIKKDEELSRFPDGILMRAGHTITHRRWVRLFFWLLCSTIVFGLALLGLGLMPRPRIPFPDSRAAVVAATTKPLPQDNNSTSDPFEGSLKEESILPWSYTFSIILSMTAQTVFLRINFVYKFLLNVVALLAYVIHYDYYNSSINPLFVSDWAFMNYDDTIIYAFYLLYMLCILHVLDRQIEYTSRVDFLSQKRLEDERLEVTVMAQTNHCLLENLLPAHVAKHYLNGNNNNELYHEEYQSVAVMFASIPNFIEFYRETTGLSREGPSCLRVLNEVICEFDRLLYNSKFSRVEKLKTVGATYMAATGLEFGRSSNDSSTPISETRQMRSEDPHKNAKTMLRFAIAIQEALQEINLHSWQEFRLRVGVAIGPVVAGVVGATKPQYDIWGDTVNMASRMDSTGEAGRIQITAEVYELIKDDSHFAVEERGEIFVKGKGMVRAYLLCSKNDWPAQSLKM
ncbi:adenylate cyclase type 2-like isoform X2 [Varroa destructor]|uniref:adenylate cyclase n=1 Tax=Varroa destructor TaxID=109461 RepID=A0A7M7K9F1_VARDE|nr:adenylate cyclase type 2-like isoform X2 [Varroa destructor]